MPYRLTDEAIEDLDEIHDFIAVAGGRQDFEQLLADDLRYGKL